MAKGTVKDPEGHQSKPRWFFKKTIQVGRLDLRFYDDNRVCYGYRSLFLSQYKSSQNFLAQGLPTANNHNGLFRR